MKTHKEIVEKYKECRELMKASQMLLDAHISKEEKETQLKVREENTLFAIALGWVLDVTEENLDDP